MAKKRHYEQDLQARDSKMLSSDYSAVANLPQSVMYHAWPKASGYADYSMNDDIGGIDKQMKEDVAGMKRSKGGLKY